MRFPGQGGGMRSARWMLFIILIAFCINSLFMPDAGKGLSFLFRPDFSQLTPKSVLSAMGQAFFSLSLGLGCLITYAAHSSEAAERQRAQGSERHGDANVETCCIAALHSEVVAHAGYGNFAH